MSTEITKQHNELLEYFQWEFSDYGDDFTVKLVVDETLQDTYGLQYQNVCIILDDKIQEYVVLIDENNSFHYNVYEVMEDISYASDMWKWMYFNTRQKYNLY